MTPFSLAFVSHVFLVVVSLSYHSYAYVSMGEYAAFLAAACLTLEYGVSGAAVARSWGDKILEWKANMGDSVAEESNGEPIFNPLAGLISLLSTVVLACGVQESKRVTNFFTVVKLGLVAFMIIGGFWLFQAENMVPLVIPAQPSASGTIFGAAGIFRGATSSFFGYLGFDEVVCLAAEAKNPNDTPKAVLWTVAVVTVIYILASIALSGMIPYQEVSDTSGFPSAFASLGISWAANLTAFGEIFTLPVVVLVCLLAQPRLCAAMAKDGLLPAIFALQSEKDGNLFWSNILCGIPMTILATFVPFSWMDDGISVGILVAFNMTNTALVIMRCGGKGTATSSDRVQDAALPADQEVVAVDEPNGIVSSSSRKLGSGGHRWSLLVHLAGFHFVALIAGLSSHLTVPTALPSTNDGDESSFVMVDTPWWSAQIAAACVVLAHAAWLHKRFPTTGGFGDFVGERSPAEAMNNDGDDSDRGFHRGPTTTNQNPSEAIFLVPLCPFLPLVGVYLNWYLILQLEWSGMILLLLYLVIFSVLYGVCISGKAHSPTTAAGLHHQQQRYSPVLNPVDEIAATTAASKQDGPVMLRDLSLPRRLSSGLDEAQPESSTRSKIT